MKRICVFLLTAVLLLGFAACAAEPADTSAPSSARSSGGTATDTAVTDPATDTETKKTSTEEEHVMLEHKLIALTDQKNDEIVVIDLSADDVTDPSAVVWSWSASKHGDVEYAKRSNHRLDDVKLRYCEAWGGYVVGMTSSSGLIALVSYPSGECLFNVDASGYGPHSIEILPNGLIVVACSGNSRDDMAEIQIYSALSKTGSAHIFDKFSSAHGVCWDPENELLWALGSNEIRAYAVSGTREKPVMTQIQGMGMKLDATGGHDLSPVYGNTDRLWVTYGKGIVQYSKSENRILTSYVASAAISAKNAKSVNSFTDGTVVWTIADKQNATAEHNTNVLNLFTYVKGDSGRWLQRTTKYTFADRDFYKVRAFVSDYQ